MVGQDQSDKQQTASDSIDRLIENEVRVVTSKPKGTSAPIMGFLLVCLILAGASYFYFQVLLPQQQLKTQTADDNFDLRIPMPERPVASAGGQPGTASQGTTTLAANQTTNVSAAEEKATGAKIDAAPTVTENNASATSEPTGSEPLAKSPGTQLEIGPFIRGAGENGAEALLKELGLPYHKRGGIGDVEMIRLLDGTYPTKAGRARLEKIQAKVPSAFVLPHANGLAVYLASFYEQSRADQMTQELQAKGFKVSQVRSKIVLDRTLLTTEELEQEQLQTLMKRLEKEEISSRIVEK